MSAASVHYMHISIRRLRLGFSYKHFEKIIYTPIHIVNLPGMFLSRLRNPDVRTCFQYSLYFVPCITFWMEVVIVVYLLESLISQQISSFSTSYTTLIVCTITQIDVQLDKQQQYRQSRVLGW